MLITLSLHDYYMLTPTGYRDGGPNPAGPVPPAVPGPAAPAVVYDDVLQ
jgi:hypothetical protein